MLTKSTIPALIRYRARASELADFYCGLTARGSMASDLDLLLFPHDEPTQARRMTISMSSCALFALAIWRELGVPHPILRQPYAKRIGRAVSDVVTIASAYGAWTRFPSPGGPLGDVREGDVVLMGPPEHVIVVTTVDEVDGRTVYGVAEGGQVSAEGYAIGRGQYIIDGSMPRKPIVRSVKNPAYSTSSPSKGRHLMGVASLERLLSGAKMI